MKFRRQSVDKPEIQFLFDDQQVKEPQKSSEFQKQ